MNNKRIYWAAAILIVASITLAACGGGNAEPSPLNITLKGQDIKFDVTTFSAKAGQTINVTYVNEGILDHTFVIDGLVAEQKVTAGQEVTFSFTPTSAGTYTYYCNVAGHKEAGMVGTLTVSDN